MKEFLKNIIPRIQKYSKGLDKIEVFVDKTEPWIYVDDNGGQHQYIFLREDKRLVMIFDGVTKVGKWELLPTNQLLIDRISDLITLDHLFVEKALLILKRSGTDDLPFVLISREEIPDLDVETYLEKFEREKETIGIPQGDIKYKVLKNGKLSGPIFYKGLKIVTDNGDILSGTYNTTYLDSTQFVEIENNTITRLFYKIEMAFEKRIIISEQKVYSEPQKGDKLLLEKNHSIPINIYFKLTDKHGNVHTVMCDSSGLIIKVKDDEFKNILLGVMSILIFVIIFALITKR